MDPDHKNRHFFPLTTLKNTSSIFIFLVYLLISQGCRPLVLCGQKVQGRPVVKMVQVVKMVKVVKVVQVVSVMRELSGLGGLSGQSG